MLLILLILILKSNFFYFFCVLSFVKATKTYENISYNKLYVLSKGYTKVIQRLYKCQSQKKFSLSLRLATTYSIYYILY